MLTFTFLVDLNAELRKSDSIDVNKIIAPILIGSNHNLLKYFDENTKYKKGDKCTYIMENGELTVIVATQDTVGPFDARVWEEWNVLSELENLYSDYSVLSWNEPRLRLNKTWLKIKNESLQMAKDLNFGNTTGVLIYRNLIIDDKRPTMSPDIIWGQVTGVAE